jgi:hypothetical protein
MNSNISSQISTSRLSAPVAAGVDGARVNLPEIDAQAFPKGFRVVITLGAVLAGGVVTVRAKGSGTSATYGAGTIGDLGTLVATNPNNGVLIYEIHKPLHRFIRLDYQRTVANSVIESVVVEAMPDKIAPNNPFDVILNSPQASVV